MGTCNHNSRISPNNFLHNNTFFQPNVKSINSFNANFKKQRESVVNQISNKAKNTNRNLDIEELINLRTLYTNNAIIGYLNIISLRNIITRSTLLWRRLLSYRNQSNDLFRKSIVWFLYDNGFRHERVNEKAPIDMLCIDETKLDFSFQDAQFYIEGYQYLTNSKIIWAL